MLKKTSLVAIGSNQGPNRPSSSLLSPRSLPSFSSKNFFSMIDHSKNSPCSSPRNGAPSSCGIGSPVAGLAGVLAGGAEEGCKNRVLFGMRRRVQLPAPKKGFGDQQPASSPTPIEFGVKNRDAQLALLSPVQRSPLSSAARAAQSEVELAEDYTCVITRGPNPRTTHIFEDCVVKSCDGGAAADACCFLSCCYGCKKRFGQFGKDSLMHRGEKSFCSRQCRYQQMLFDGKIGELRDSSVKP